VIIFFDNKGQRNLWILVFFGSWLLASVIGVVVEDSGQDLTENMWFRSFIIFWVVWVIFGRILTPLLMWLLKKIFKKLPDWLNG
jgi:hypothetical protein